MHKYLLEVEIEVARGWGDTIYGCPKAQIIRPFQKQSFILGNIVCTTLHDQHSTTKAFQIPANFQKALISHSFNKIKVYAFFHLDLAAVPRDIDFCISSAPIDHILIYWVE